MIIILKPSIHKNSSECQHILQMLNTFSDLEIQMNETIGALEKVTEIYLLGHTEQISKENIEALPGVAKVVRITHDYKILGRRVQQPNGFAFEYKGVSFSQNNFNLFAGLCAVDNRQNVQQIMRTLQAHGQVCTRMGVYKPRTSPYAFQGLGQTCLPYVFELAGNHGIKIIAMEVTHERQIEEITTVLDQLGHPTGVMLQIGTRNAQNFELLRAVGAQTTFPVLFKRGYGITLNESLHAAEYLAQSGNQKIIFCLRGVKSQFGAPHRNLVDFAHVSVIQRLTRMPICVDPSHAVGSTAVDLHGISDIFHATAQGVISGANMVLVDFHPFPAEAIVDSRQAMPLDKLGWYLDDIQTVRQAYEKRKQLAQQWASP